MDMKTLEDVKACLDDERRLFHYYDDQYAVYLLSKLIADDQFYSIAKIRKSSFAKLLDKPCVKLILQACGSGVINLQDLNQIYGDSYDSLVVTLDKWGDERDYGWVQTSRPGANLVLQFNFTNEHDTRLKQLKIDGETFKYRSHPIHRFKSSLAWSRLDIDLDSGVALIEEIQTDWLRKTARHHKIAKRAVNLGMEQYRAGGEWYVSQSMIEYTSNILRRFSKRWSEMVMLYTLRFIREELGIKIIYYNDFETGSRLKRLKSTRPPKSLYTELPRKFCFQKTEIAPQFIVDNKIAKRRYKNIKSPRWLKLEIA